jgi:Uma2 family endonuclease
MAFEKGSKTLAHAATKRKQNIESPPRVKMSFQEYITWDGDGCVDRRVEWVGGEVVELPWITRRHAMIVGFLIRLLGGLIELRSLGELLFEPFTMRAEPNGNGRCPDLFLVLTHHADRIKERFLDGPADLVIEVVSDSSTKTDYMEKYAEYQHSGVPEYWIIDPIQQVTTFLLLGDDKTYRESELTVDGAFESPALGCVAIDPKWFHAENLPAVMPILKQWGLI